MGLFPLLHILLRLEGISLPLKNPVLIFSTILFIILFAPIILNKLRIPHLIGLIIAGAVIGENGFHLISRDGAFTLFGQVGLLYIMFLAGLEIDLAEFKKNSGKSLVFGMYTFLIPAGVGTIVGIYILGFSLQSSLLIAAMLASHTLIAYPIVSKLGMSKNRAVNVAIGATLIADILALLILAIISDSVKGTLDDQFWWRLAFSVIAMAVVIMFVFPIIGRWFFKRNDDSISQYIFVLGIVFLGAFLAEVAGVEAIIGAFLSGLAINRLIPNTSPLMNRIEFVGNALFIPFFLIGVGMLLNYKVFYENLETLKVGAIITIAATVTKYAASWLGQKTFGFTTDERRILFGLSNARVAASLAIVLVGYNTILGQAADGTMVRLLNENVLNGTIVMILITCTIASFSAQKGARNMAILDNTNDTKDETDISEKILIALDDQSLAEEMMNLSITIKSKHNRDGLYALHVLQNDNPSQSDVKAAEKVLEKAATAAAATDNYVHQLKRYDSNIVHGISGVVREHDITDLIIGLHKRKEGSEGIMGYVTTGILAKCNITTMIYKPVQPLSTIKRNLVIVPEKAEREIGLPFWLIKLWNISKNTGSKLVIYGNDYTIDFIKNVAKSHPVDIVYKLFTDWDDFLILGKELRSDDNLYIVMSRRNHPSYTPAMQRIPHYLSKYFTDSSFVLIYPMQSGGAGNEANDLINPSVLEPIQDNLDRLDEIGRNISKIFKKRS